MRQLIISLAILCLPLKSWAEQDAILDALQEFLEFAEYSDGAITPGQMSSAGLKALYVVDTRLKDQFDKAHIPGAVNIEWREILVKRDQLPSDKPVVLYCDTGLLSSKAHFALRLLGYENVKVMIGGFDSWVIQQELGSLDK